jgi:hypothetical protein
MGVGSGLRFLKLFHNIIVSGPYTIARVAYEYFIKVGT